MKNILIIGAVFWLFFLNGFSTLNGLIKNTTAPQIIATGANRVLQTVSPAQQPIQANFIPVVPTQEIPTQTPVIITATPVPETETPVIIVVTDIPESVKMPTETPLPTFPPAIYPTNGMQWALRQTTDAFGNSIDCVYIYTLNKRVCWSPGVHPSEKDVRWIVGMTEANYIKGEEIPVNEQ